MMHNLDECQDEELAPLQENDPADIRVSVELLRSNHLGIFKMINGRIC